MTLTLTDSGVDLLLEAAERPGLAALRRWPALPNIVISRAWSGGHRGEEILVVERRRVRVLLSGVAVPFPPGGFLQASAAAEAILVEEALAGIGPRRPVLDLFAGLGTFTFALARSRPVHAVEGDVHAVAALARAAAGRAGVTVERRDLARNPFPSEALAAYAAAVFDPPRAGALRQAEALAASTIADGRRGLLQPRDLCTRRRAAGRGRFLPRTCCAGRPVRVDAASRACGGVPPVKRCSTRAQPRTADPRIAVIGTAKPPGQR